LGTSSAVTVAPPISSVQPSTVMVVPLVADEAPSPESDQAMAEVLPVSVAIRVVAAAPAVTVFAAGPTVKPGLFATAGVMTMIAVAFSPAAAAVQGHVRRRKQAACSWWLSR